jgi:hypothetical protein
LSCLSDCFLLLHSAVIIEDTACLAYRVSHIFSVTQAQKFFMLFPVFLPNKFMLNPFVVLKGGFPEDLQEGKSKCNNDAGSKFHYIDAKASTS